MATPTKQVDPNLSDRLLIIETFIKVPPSTDYSRGYLACLMDEAADDVDEAASDIFNDALAVIRDDSHRAYLVRRRTLTLR